MALFDYRIGTTLGGMTNIEDLPTPIPNMQSFYKPFQQTLTLGDGTTRGVGFPEAVWQWNFLTREQRDQLRQFCPSSSAIVFIRTRISDNGDEYKTFQAVMHWPNDEERFARKRTDFKIRFTHLIEQI